jgi:hypothetical protein
MARFKNLNIFNRLPSHASLAWAILRPSRRLQCITDVGMPHANNGAQVFDKTLKPSLRIASDANATTVQTNQYYRHEIAITLGSLIAG